MLKLLIFRCTRCSETGAHSDHFLLHINTPVPRRALACALGKPSMLEIPPPDLPPRRAGRGGVGRLRFECGREAPPAVPRIARRGGGGAEITKKVRSD